MIAVTAVTAMMHFWGNQITAMMYVVVVIVVVIVVVVVVVVAAAVVVIVVGSTDMVNPGAYQCFLLSDVASGRQIAATTATTATIAMQ